MQARTSEIELKCMQDLQRVGVYTSILTPVKERISKMGVGIYPVLYSKCFFLIVILKSGEAGKGLLYS